MRSTQKQVNKMLDYIKTNSNCKSRRDAQVYLFDVIGKAYKTRGISLSFYLNGCFTLTKDNLVYKHIANNELFTPQLTVNKYFS